MGLIHCALLSCSKYVLLCLHSALHCTIYQKRSQKMWLSRIRTIFVLSFSTMCIVCIEKTRVLLETVKESRKNWNFHFDLQLHPTVLNGTYLYVLPKDWFCSVLLTQWLTTAHHAMTHSMWISSLTTTQWTLMMVQRTMNDQGKGEEVCENPWTYIQIARLLAPGIKPPTSG